MAIELDSQTKLAWYQRGCAYQDKCFLDKAENDFNKALEIDPFWDWAFVGRGCNYRLKGDFNKALEDFN